MPPRNLFSRSPSPFSFSPAAPIPAPRPKLTIGRVKRTVKRTVRKTVETTVNQGIKSPIKSLRKAFDNHIHIHIPKICYLTAFLPKKRHEEFVESTKAPDDCTTGFEAGTIIEPFIEYDWDDGCRISHKKKEAEGLCAKCQKLRDYLIDLERRCMRMTAEKVERERLAFRENGWVGMPEGEAVDDDLDRFNEDTFGKEEEVEEWDEEEVEDENEAMDEEDGTLSSHKRPFRLSKRQLQKLKEESERFKKSEPERQKKFQEMQRRREKLLASWSEVAERERLLEEQRKSLHWTDRRYTPEMIEEEKAKSQALIRELSDDYLARAWP